MPEPLPEPADPETALRLAVAAGGSMLLLGDRDPEGPVRAAALAAGRPCECVDARGLLTIDFDAILRGRFVDGVGWQLGALSRMLEAGGVFLLAHGETLLDDLRQRTVRTLLTRRVILRAPRRADDRDISAAPGATLLLHLDDHTPLLLQCYVVMRQVPDHIRLDVDGPPPVGRR